MNDQFNTTRQLSPAGRSFLNVVKFVAVVGILLGVFFGGKWAYNKYYAKNKESKVFAQIDLPTAPVNAAATVGPFVQPSTTVLANINKPAQRFGVMQWNSQLSLMNANGGIETMDGSIMAKNGVKVKLILQDDCYQGLTELVNFAQAYEKDPNTTVGYNYYAIMGDAGASLITPYYEKLFKDLGPEYQPIIIGSCGKSFGEDAFMGPVSLRQDPQNAKGLLVAAVVRDGDWNIVCKWAFDNKIDINPDDKTYNPNAINFYNTSTYLEAANAYITGVKAKLWVVDSKGKKTGDQIEVPVGAVTTWTPGDMNVATMKGGLVRIASTREYAAQMPNTIITIKKWAYDHTDDVVGMLDAIFKGADQVKSYSAALDLAARVSSEVYNANKENNGKYWADLSNGKTVSDKQGLMVEVGGSAPHNLADNMLLYGMNGGTNIYADVYKVFGDLVVTMYPELLPSYPSIDKILDLTFIKKVAERTTNMSAATQSKINLNAPVTQVVSVREWSIEFESGKATLTLDGVNTLEQLKRELSIGSGGNLAIEIHGYTDNTGTPEGNVILGRERAETVKSWLTAKDAVNIGNRIKEVVSHGQNDAKTSNATAAGRAANRRVVIKQVK